MLTKIAKTQLLKSLASIPNGELSLADISEKSKTYTFGTQNPKFTNANITVNNSEFYRLIALKGSLGAAQAYIEKYWETDNLTAVFEFFLQNHHFLQRLETGFAKFNNIFNTINYKIKKNTVKNSKNHILAHYDLGNDFFKLLLDSKLIYSSAVYQTPNDTLSFAQVNKLQNIAHKLSLTSDEHILEIGSGWGGLAIYLAENYGCKVTTITISKRQYEYVTKLITEKNLADKVFVKLQDYRTLNEKFDAIVSIEMIEAVGYQYFKTFFQTINKSLKPNGKLFLQAITINDKNFERAKAEVDFIKKYVFPGGCLPSMQVIADNIAEHTNLSIESIDNIGQSYVLTLQAWLENLNQHREDILKLGFDEEFLRVWEYYFCYCIAGFKLGYINNLQGLWINRDLFS